MKNLYILIGTILFATILSRAQNMQEMSIGDFSAIELEGKLNVILIQGEKSGIKVESNSDNQALAEIEIKNGVLEVTSKGNSGKPVIVHITVKEINKLEMEGQVNVNTENEITTNKLEIESETIGTTVLSLNVKELDLDVDAIGSVTLKGKCEKIDADMEGVGSLNAIDMKARTVILNLSGIGGAKINVTDTLIAEVSGVGSIEYIGNPYVKKVKKSELGSVGEYRRNTKNTSDSTTKTISYNDTTKLKWGNKKIIICEEEENKEKENDNDEDDFKHWSGVLIGINGYTNFSGKFDMPKGYEFMQLDYSKSWNFQINPFQKNIHLHKNYLNLVTGLGFEFVNYSFKNNTVLHPGTYVNSLDPSNNRISAHYDSLVDFNKNKLKAAYVNVPLLLEWHSSEKSDNAFHIAAGATVGYRLNAKTKQTYEQNGESYKRVIKDDYHLSPLKLSATAMIGYSDFTLFANYGLTELFNKSEGPKLYPFTVGVSIGL